MKIKLWVIVTCTWLLTSGAAAPVRMTPVKIADGVYMFQHSQGSGNSTVVITDEFGHPDLGVDAAGKTLEQIEKEFKVPQEFAHYKRPERLKQFYKLFYNQLLERGY
jgi:hypothetical protein